MALDAQWSAVARSYRVTLVLAAVLGVVALAVAALSGHWIAGIFICAGLALGVWNARRLWSDTERLADGSAEAGERWRGPATVSSARRLGLITLLAFLIALAYRPVGWTVFLGLLAFQVLLVAIMAPSLKRVIRP